MLGIRDFSQERQALNAALVLMADHELTTPTFVARISASSRLRPAVVSSGCLAGTFRLRIWSLRPLGGAYRIEFDNGHVSRLRSDFSRRDDRHQGSIIRCIRMAILARISYWISLWNWTNGAAAHQALELITAHFPTVQTQNQFV